MASASIRIGARHIARRGALLGGSGSTARAAGHMLASENVQGAASASAWRDSVRRPFTARSFASSADDKKEAGEKAAAGEGAAEGGATVEELQALLTEKNVLLVEKDAEVADMKDKSLRVLADMENLRERTARQVESSQKFAIQGFAKDLLDFVDNLERATGSLPEDFASKSGEEATKLLTSYHQGILMTQRQILSPKTIMIDELDGQGPAEIRFNTEDEFQSYLKQNKVKRLEAGRGDGLKFVLKLSDVAEGGEYRFPAFKARSQPKTIMIDELDGQGPAEIRFNTEDEFQSYLKQNKVKRLEAGRGDGLKFVLKLSDVAEGGEYRFPAFKARSQPKTIMIDQNDGMGPVSVTFRNENSFLSYLSQAGVGVLEVVGSEVVERTREFLELDQSKVYRWPEDLWSSSLGKQVAMLEGGLSNLDSVFIVKLARFLSTRLSIEFGELDVRMGVKFVWDSKDLDVDVLLLSKDMLHCVLVEAKRKASEGVIAQQEQTIKGYEAVFNIQQKGAKIHPIVAAQLWEDGAKDAVLEKGWWAVSDVFGSFDLEKPQGPT